MKLNLTKLALTAGLSLGIISFASVAEAGVMLENGSSLTGHLPQPTTKWQPLTSKRLINNTLINHETQKELSLFNRI